MKSMRVYYIGKSLPSTLAFQKSDLLASTGFSTHL